MRSYTILKWEGFLDVVDWNSEQHEIRINVLIEKIEESRSMGCNLDLLHELMINYRLA